MLRPALASIILITATMTVQAQVGRDAGATIISSPSMLHRIAGFCDDGKCTVKIPRGVLKQRPQAQLLTVETELSSIGNTTSGLADILDAATGSKVWADIDYGVSPWPPLPSPAQGLVDVNYGMGAYHSRRRITRNDVKSHCSQLPQLWDTVRLHLAPQFKISKFQPVPLNPPPGYHNPAGMINVGAISPMENNSFRVMGPIWEAETQQGFKCASETAVHIWVRGPRGLNPFTGKLPVRPN